MLDLSELPRVFVVFSRAIRGGNVESSSSFSLIIYSQVAVLVLRI